MRFRRSSSRTSMENSLPVPIFEPITNEGKTTVVLTPKSGADIDCFNENIHNPDNYLFMEKLHEFKYNGKNTVGEYIDDTFYRYDLTLSEDVFNELQNCEDFKSRVNSDRKRTITILFPKNPDDFEMVTQPAVIMAPSILLTPAEIKNTKRSKKVYLLIEDVVCDGSIDKRVSIYTNQEEAKSILELYVRCSMSYGTLRYLLKKPECIQNSTENSYEAFVMGMYDDIINLERPKSNRPLMSLKESLSALPRALSARLVMK